MCKVYFEKENDSDGPYEGVPAWWRPEPEVCKFRVDTLELWTYDRRWFVLRFTEVHVHFHCLFI